MWASFKEIILSSDILHFEVPLTLPSQEAKATNIALEQEPDQDPDPRLKIQGWSGKTPPQSQLAPQLPPPQRGSTTAEKITCESPMTSI